MHTTLTLPTHKSEDCLSGSSAGVVLCSACSECVCTCSQCSDLCRECDCTYESSPHLPVWSTEFVASKWATFHALFVLRISGLVCGHRCAYRCLFVHCDMQGNCIMSVLCHDLCWLLQSVPASFNCYLYVHNFTPCITNVYVGLYTLLRSCK